MGKREVTVCDFKGCASYLAPGVEGGGIIPCLVCEMDFCAEHAKRIQVEVRVDFMAVKNGSLYVSLCARCLGTTNIESLARHVAKVIQEQGRKAVREALATKRLGLPTA